MMALRQLQMAATPQLGLHVGEGKYSTSCKKSQYLKRQPVHAEAGGSLR